MPMLLEPVGPPLGVEEPLTTEGPTWPDTHKSCRPSPDRDWNLANARWTSARIARRNYERESRRAPHCSVLPKDTPRFVVPGSTGATRFPWPRTWASTDPKATGGWGLAHRLESIAATPGSRARAMLCAGRAGSLSLGTRTWQGRARSDAPRTPSRRPTPM